MYDWGLNGRGLNTSVKQQTTTRKLHHNDSVLAVQGASQSGGRLCSASSRVCLQIPRALKGASYPKDDSHVHSARRTHEKIEDVLSISPIFRSTSANLPLEFSLRPRTGPYEIDGGVRGVQQGFDGLRDAPSHPVVPNLQMNWEGFTSDAALAPRRSPTSASHEQVDESVASLESEEECTRPRTPRSCAHFKPKIDKSVLHIRSSARG